MKRPAYRCDECGGRIYALLNGYYCPNCQEERSKTGEKN